VPKVKIEVFAPDKFGPARGFETITRSAKTGSVGDGKIFVFDLSSVVRIRNWREQGKAHCDDNRVRYSRLCYRFSRWLELFKN